MDDPEVVAEMVRDIESQMQALDAAARLLKGTKRPNLIRILLEIEAERKELLSGLTYFRRRRASDRGEGG